MYPNTYTLVVIRNSFIAREHFLASDNEWISDYHYYIYIYHLEEATEVFTNGGMHYPYAPPLKIKLSLYIFMGVIVANTNSPELRHSFCDILHALREVTTNKLVGTKFLVWS